MKKRKKFNPFGKLDVRASTEALLNGSLQFTLEGYPFYSFKDFVKLSKEGNYLFGVEIMFPYIVEWFSMYAMFDTAATATAAAKTIATKAPKKWQIRVIKYRENPFEGF